jgi:hypothetical protein
MALVSAINIFERFPAETLQLCLTEVKKLLRPGGRIVFNVFDAHTPSVARQMSEGTISGITKQQMSSIANALGLNITTWTKVFANDFVVVTLTAPGQLQSSKTDPSRAVRRKS